MLSISSRSRRKLRSTSREYCCDFSIAYSLISSMSSELGKFCDRFATSLKLYSEHEENPGVSFIFFFAQKLKSPKLSLFIFVFFFIQK